MAGSGPNGLSKQKVTNRSAGGKRLFCWPAARGGGPGPLGGLACSRSNSARSRAAAWLPWADKGPHSERLPRPGPGCPLQPQAPPRRSGQLAAAPGSRAGGQRRRRLTTGCRPGLAGVRRRHFSDDRGRAGASSPARLGSGQPRKASDPRAASGAVPAWTQGAACA